MAHKLRKKNQPFLDSGGKIHKVLNKDLVRVRPHHKTDLMKSAREYNQTELPSK